jgi:HSP20 family protein
MKTITPASSDRLLAPLATIPACRGWHGEVDWFPPVDILEDAEEYLFRIDLPETKPEDIRVVVEGDGLCISGERPEPWLENKTCLRVERPHGRFERRFALPDDSHRAEINSVLNASVLEVHVRKVRSLAKNPPAANTPPRLKLVSAS